MSDLQITDHGLYRIAEAIDRFSEALVDAACLLAHFTPEQIERIHALVEQRDARKR